MARQAGKMRNIEIKARLDDLCEARRVAQSLKAEVVGEGEQVDTYFHSPQGRMKLRVSTFEAPASLIWYMRPDEPDARISDYRLAKLKKLDKLRDYLALRFGVKGTVRKKRTILRCDGALIHLDDVEGLGQFIEFEVPVDESEQQARRTIAKLMKTFRIPPDRLVPESYSDLLFRNS